MTEAGFDPGASGAGSDITDDAHGEAAVRQRIKALLNWAELELDLLSSAFRGCTDEQLAQVCEAERVDGLPPAYHEFLRLAGQGGVGSAVVEIFPGDDVDLASLLPADDWAGMRALAQEIVAESSHEFDLQGHVVLRVRRLAEFEFAPVGHINPPVFGWGEGGASRQPQFESVSEWLERGISRAIKRRYPLRDAHFTS